ncbi:DUF4139 domain-containing protein [Novosphingobium sp.]|uniref:DUF4139 domain-containing protein n=1 Tax=Novosphingobium sp. TaxID=1874826 RepID=UPI0025ED4D22|nr:DUF4139 domain-containing protein [Novosphingobium sp.]MCC6925156.1 DUF4139 domain-containing protein [Novosphingobium sp.]
MHFKRVSTLALGLLGAAQPVLAQAPANSPAQGGVSVTIYSDMALVEDVRTLQIPAGTSRQEFPDVSAMIRPETVSLTGEGIEIAEQNFDFDLLSPEKLMQKAEGQTITIIRKDPVTGVARPEVVKVLAVNGGVVMETGGKIEVLRDDGTPTRVIFDRIPPNLRARPTLSVTLDSTHAGARPLTLSYLSGGLGWNADYVGMFDEGKGLLNLQGWVTLTNTSGTAFRDADVTLAAGDVLKLNRREERRMNQGGMSSAGSETSSDDKVGDLYLYKIDGRTTVATNQKKQVSFLDADGLPAKRAYKFSCNWMCRYRDPISALSVLKFTTGKKSGLGRALPAGVVRVYMRDENGKARFVGESRIEHTPAGSEVEMITGFAFDVKVQPVIEKRERVNEAEWVKTAEHRIYKDGGVEPVQTVSSYSQREYWRTTVRYTLTNARKVPVVVDVEQNQLQGWNQATRVLSESQEGKQDGADTRTWPVAVPAGGKAELVVTYMSSF